MCKAHSIELTISQAKIKTKLYLYKNQNLKKRDERMSIQSVTYFLFYLLLTFWVFGENFFATLKYSLFLSILKFIKVYKCVQKLSSFLLKEKLVCDHFHHQMQIDAFVRGSHFKKDIQ